MEFFKKIREIKINELNKKYNYDNELKNVKTLSP